MPAKVPATLVHLERPRRADAVRRDADGKAPRPPVGDPERVHQRRHDHSAEGCRSGSRGTAGERRIAAERLRDPHGDAGRHRFRRERGENGRVRAEQPCDGERRDERGDRADDERGRHREERAQDLLAVLVERDRERDRRRPEQEWTNCAPSK